MNDGFNIWEDSTQRYNPTVGSGMNSILSGRRTVHLTLTNISLATVVDPTDNVKGMYRLLDLISESGSNGYGKGYLLRNNPSKLQFGLIS
jgi:hypothetical protein